MSPCYIYHPRKGQAGFMLLKVLAEVEANCLLLCPLTVVVSSQSQKPILLLKLLARIVVALGFRRKRVFCFLGS